MADDLSRPPSVLGMALAHPLNVILVGAIGASAALTGSLLPLAVGAAAELLWLGVGARLGASRDFFEHRKRQHLLAHRTRGQQARLAAVSEADRQRFLALDRLRGDIRDLVAKSDGLEQGMLEPELEKVDRLVESFLELAARAARYEAFVQDTDLDRLEGEVRTQRTLVERAPDPDAQALAADNLEVMETRLERAAEVRRLLKTARGQLNLVENTLELMRDQVASLQSPARIKAQLDDLVRSVETTEATVKETRALEAHALHERS